MNPTYATFEHQVNNMVGSTFDELKLHCSESKNVTGCRGNNDNLASHLERMSLHDAGGCVPVSVGGETFLAHPAVLAARSPFLKDQLLSKDIDGGITLSSIEPGTFRVVLQFMCDDTLPSEEELTIESLHRLLAAAADMFHMDELKITCTEKLMERVSPETVAATLCCAEAHHCPELKKRCIDYVFSCKDDVRTILISEGWYQVVMFYPSIIDEFRTRLGLETKNPHSPGN